jgi:hypothetical protein
MVITPLLRKLILRLDIYLTYNMRNLRFVMSMFLFYMRMMIVSSTYYKPVTLPGVRWETMLESGGYVGIMTCPIGCVYHGR